MDRTITRELSQLNPKDGTAFREFGEDFLAKIWVQERLGNLILIPI